MVNTTQRNARIKFLWIALVCALPIVLSYFFYFVSKPQGGMSYGQLLETKSVANMALQGNTVKSLADFQGKWVLLMVAGGACDKACQERLFAIRQYRAGQGLEAQRMTRVWIVDDLAPITSSIPIALLAGVHIVRAQPITLDFPPLWHQAIFLLDPQGRQVMLYQLGQDHRKVMNEISKILKNNTAQG